MSVINKGSVKLLVTNYTIELRFKLFLKVLNFLNQIISFRILGIVKFGHFAFYQYTQSVLNMVIGLGQVDGLIRYIPEIKTTNSELIFPFLKRIYLRVTLFSLLLLTIFVLFSHFFLTLFHVPSCSSFMLTLLVVSIFCSSQISLFSTFQTINYENNFLAKQDMIINLFSLFGFYLLFLVHSISITTLLALNCLVLFYNLFSHFKKIDIIKLLTVNTEIIDKQLWKSFNVYCFKSLVSNCIGSLYQVRGIAYYIQLFFSSSALSIYKILSDIWEKSFDILMPRRFVVSMNAFIFEKKPDKLKEMRDIIRLRLSLLLFLSSFLYLLSPLLFKFIFKVPNLNQIVNPATIPIFFFMMFSTWWGHSFLDLVCYMKKIEIIIVLKLISFSLSFVFYKLFIHFFSLPGLLFAYILLSNIEYLFIIIYLKVFRKLQNLPLANVFLYFSVAIGVFSGLFFAPYLIIKLILFSLLIGFLAFSNWSSLRYFRVRLS